MANPWESEPYPSDEKLLFGHATVGPAAKLVAIHSTLPASCLSGGELARIEMQVNSLRKEVESHLAEVRARGELAQHVLEIFGLGGVTTSILDTLADEAYLMIQSEGTLDPLTFAERKDVDIRVSDLVFRQLQRQGRISEA
ncbi:MAG: hypothetical protein JRM77_08350 [Nitrososphaerota archaeon]|jgi:hypothetical protein|nr:hypothetical protein [Nitrososphaerota archaeon]